MATLPPIVAEIDDDREAACDLGLVSPESGARSSTREAVEGQVGASTCSG